MTRQEVFSFSATIELIGINPFVSLPPAVLEKIFIAVGREKGPIPVKGSINGIAYQQTLIKYSGQWRLYINTTMLPRSPSRIGEQLSITISFDPSDRSIPMPVPLKLKLESNKAASTKFDSLSPSLQAEIIRYIARLKTDESIDRNVDRALQFLMGKERFIGRDPL